MLGMFATVQRRIVVGGLSLTLLLFGVLLVVSTPASSDETAPIDTLTGKDVGLALGLTPYEEGVGPVDCSGIYAEYSESGVETGAGFCLTGVTDDPVEEYVLAIQIQGYTRTAAVQAYAAALVDWKTTRVGVDDTAESATLMRAVSDAAAKLEAQGLAEGS